MTIELNRGARTLALLLASLGLASVAVSAIVKTPFPLGAYVGNPDAWNAANQALFQANYNSFVKLMGVAPEFIDTAVDYSAPLSGWIGSASAQAQSNARSADARPLIPVIGLGMYSIAKGALTPDQQYKAFASGSCDGIIRGIVDSWAEQGFKILYIRLGWEMNLPGTPTFVGDGPQNQSDWIKAFQHIYTVLHQAAKADGANVQVVWNPGVISYSRVQATRDLYPGDDYVDIIGADFYADMSPAPEAGDRRSYHDWATGGQDTSVAQFVANPANREHYWAYPAANQWTNDGSSGHSQSFDSLIAFAKQHGKPFAVPEAGAGNSKGGGEVNDDPDFPRWLAARLHGARKDGIKIEFVIIWDSDIGGGNNAFSKAANNKPEEAAAWAKYFGAATGL